MNSPIRREPLRDQIYDFLRGEILSGRLEPGTRIRETDLAEKLDVSRTPVREALLGLRAKKILSTENSSQGFLVPTLDVNEGRRLYRTVALVESAIVRDEINPGAELIASLSEITDRRAQHPNDAEKNLELDRQWHERLISETEETLVTDFLQDLRDRLLRYDLLYVYSDNRVEIALSGHRDIEDALREGALAKAAELLRKHWLEGERSMEEMGSE